VLTVGGTRMARLYALDTVPLRSPIMRADSVRSAPIRVMICSIELREAARS
jgi:hypothetical protein